MMQSEEMAENRRGGVWKLEATRNVADYFEMELQDLIDSGDVVVIR